jgi:hypothetical protein
VLAGAAAAIAVAVACTRVFLGAHWTSDVVGGLLLGWTWFAVCAVAFGGRILRLGEPAEEAAAGVGPGQTSSLVEHGERSGPAARRWQMDSGGGSPRHHFGDPAGWVRPAGAGLRRWGGTARFPSAGVVPNALAGVIGIALEATGAAREQVRCRDQARKRFGQRSPVRGFVAAHRFVPIRPEASRPRQVFEQVFACRLEDRNTFPSTTHSSS